MQDQNFLELLFNFFERFYPLSNALKLDYLQHCSLMHIKKNKFILSPLDLNDSLFFINSGIVRGFVKNCNTDITTQFAAEGEVIGPIRHPEKKEHHSEEHLQALEDCTLVKIPYNLIESVYHKYPEAHLIGRKIFAIHLYRASERSLLARLPKASERYHAFMNTDLEWANRIPLRYLASYLGMRLETLSRIRSAESKEHNLDE